MKLKTLQSELHRLDLLVGAWERKEDITTIERDLVLARLRDLYEALRFDLEEEQQEAVAPIAVPLVEAEPTPEEEPLALDADDFFSFDAVAPVAEFAAIDEPIADEPIVEEPATEVEPADEEPADEVVETLVEEEPADEVAEEVAEAETATEELIAEVVEEPMAEPAEEAIVEPNEPVVETLDEEPAIVEEPAIMEEPAIVEEPVVATPKPVQTLFGDEPVVDHHRRKQRVIMSLYDLAEPESEPRHQAEQSPVQVVPPTGEVVESEEESEVIEISEAELEEPPTVSVKAEPAPVPAEEEIEEEVEEVSEAELIATPAPKPTVEESPVVLGEKLQPRQTLGDTLAESQRVNDIRPRITDLRRAVGLNDKFLLIRDLFAGNGSLYEITIRKLNEFDDFHECMVYISQHFHWNPNSDGAKLMMDLLERKFGEQ